MTTFENFCLFAADAAGKNAMDIFAQELLLRANKKAEIVGSPSEADLCFVTDERIACKDFYRIRSVGGAGRLEISAKTVRGLIFGIGLLLRKSEIVNGRFTLIENICGEYTPDKSIRGHQMGYRTTPNSYEAWDYDQYRRYYLDLMFFGCNIVEHIPYESLEKRRNRLMKYDAEDFLVEASRIADEYDLDISIWYPNYDNQSIEDAVEMRKKLFERLPRLNVVFPPGGDPGNYDADEFVERTIAIGKALKEVCPNAEMWPSAQKPHTFINWGPDFIEEMEKLPREIDGVITGPNRAFDIDELRRRLPMQYPIRLYPDITHNVRCEYPVHYGRDDWHYALNTCLSRECTNPRPAEYRMIHRQTRDYVVGSVSYSEGITDDINKCIWTAMDVDPSATLYDALQDYARLYFVGAPAGRCADAILALELNWSADPAENPHIESTLMMWESLSVEFPMLNNHWRFVQCLFRAKMDTYCRRRRMYEMWLTEQAKKALELGDIERARGILMSPMEESCVALRTDIERMAAILFEQIGLQTDVDRYCADNWERGAVLMTIDLPITDRQWLLSRIAMADTMPPEARITFLNRVLNRNKVAKDEYYFSVAEHGLEVLGMKQMGEPYMNFQGDRPNVNNGTMPTCMFKLYDNYKLQCKAGGFTPGQDYKLRVTFKPTEYGQYLNAFKVLANGKTVYEGKPFGGEKNPQFDAELVAPGFETATYTIPADFFENGCVELDIGEKVAGVMITEFWIVKA